jgi:hypothetical protein
MVSSPLLSSQRTQFSIPYRYPFSSGRLHHSPFSSLLVYLHKLFSLPRRLLHIPSASHHLSPPPTTSLEVIRVAVGVVARFEVK